MKQIVTLISNLKGSILGFGIQEKEILESIEKNKKIIECNLLNSIDLDRKGKGRFTKNVSLKKIKKKFGYQKIDTTIIHEKELKKNSPKVLFTLLYVTKSKLYIYEMSDIDETLKKYKRYTNKIKKRDGYLEIDIEGLKLPWIKRVIYNFIDNVNRILDLITDLLTS